MSDEVEAEMMHNPGINPGVFSAPLGVEVSRNVARGCTLIS